MFEFDAVMESVRSDMARGQHETARLELEEVRFRVEGEEDRSRHAILLAECHLVLEDWQDSIDWYYRCKKLNNGRDRDMRFRSSYGLGQAFRGMSRWSSAERNLKEAVVSARTGKERDRALLQLAQGAVDVRDLAGARGYFDRISEKSLLGYESLQKSLAASGPGPKRAVELPSVPAPPIRERREWRARPLNPAGRPLPMKRPYRITIHHGADARRPPTTLSGGAERMRSYQSHHLDTKRWADIGYHYVIDGAGRIWEGREIEWQGAHAGTADLNRGNIGVCLMGNFARDEPTGRQKSSLRQLLIHLCERYRIHPRLVIGHRTILRKIPGKSTACPGRNLERYLFQLRRELPRS